MKVRPSSSPQLLQGMDDVRIKAELESPGSIVGNATGTDGDNITELICKRIGSTANVCN
jgi:hypothetical protein